MSDFPVRILHIIRKMNPGGAESMIMNLYRAIDRKKIQFDFVETTSERALYDDEIEQLGGRVYYCPRYKGYNHISYVMWWDRFFDAHATEYSVVHGHLGSTAAIYLTAAKKYGLFTIAHSHNTDGPKSFKQLLYKLYSYKTRDIADWFFACSQQAGMDRFGSDIVQHSMRFSLISNAIDTDYFSFNEHARIEQRKQLGIADSDYVIGHAGRFTPAKNHDFILSVFREISQMEKNTKLLLVGDGELFNEIRNKAETLDVGNRVIFTGLRDDVGELMQAMDLLLFPSIFEGLPLTLVEAQTAGLPCVISDCIPPDCIITKDLVTKKSLEESPRQWAEHILSRRGEQRTDHSAEVVAAGFDVRTTAKWMERFYIEKTRG